MGPSISSHSLVQQLLSNKEEYFIHLHSIQDQEYFLKYALDSLLAIAEAHAGSLFLWDEFKKEFVLKVSRGPYARSENGVSVKLREGVLGSIVDRGESVLVKDINEDMRFHSVKRYDDYRSDSFISIPLIANNRLMGVINITERRNYKPFGEADLIRTQQFSSHIAIAFENLRMNQKLGSDNDSLHEEIESLKKELKKKETFASIGKLAANLTHELNNPLDAIRRYVNLALDQIPENSLSQEYLLKAKKGIRRAIRIISGLLQFSRDIHKRTFRKADVQDIVEESLSSISHEMSFEEIVVEKEFCPNPAVIQDKGLAVVLRNLYRNAHHAMKGKGTLKVMTEGNNGVIKLSIEDSGDGIPDDIRSTIFEPFVSTKENGDGTGMGLTICREIIHQCGGEIACENGSQKGARFVITLPLIKETVEQ